ncbi:MAG TPA: peptidyl-prolyl cis-trans isomerase [Candidatus Acidoferrales bacterium]|nr:peptidyl-prolyl cis-trans isomerase [Candidatus Acidoferrales bacterium]
MNRWIASVRPWGALLLVIACVARAQQVPPRPGAPARGGVPPLGPPVASVGAVSVYKSALDAATAQASAELARRSGNRELPPEMHDFVQRQVLENLIRVELLTQEVTRTGSLGTTAEAEEILKQDPIFNPGGKFDASRYQMVKTTQPRAYDAAITALRRRIGARKLNASLEAKFLPPDGEVRAAAERALTQVTIEDVSLRTSEFNGSYPEPREAQVAAWYHSHPRDYVRPERSTLTIAFANTPELTDSIRALPGGEAAWTRSMRARADSVLELVRRGRSFDSLAAGLGSRSDVVVARDNFPAYWKGSAEQVAWLFDPKNAGHVLDQPVAATQGWLLARVDEVNPEHIAPLREVAREIRGTLRRESRIHHEENDERSLYDARRDSLAAPGVRLRLAAIDTTKLVAAEPGADELDHYYRSHQADYSSFDARSGGIVVRPFADVRSEIRERTMRDQIASQARADGERLVAAWNAGRRDAELEARYHAYEPPPAVRGGIIDTTAVAIALSDTLWRLGPPDGAGLVPYAKGWIAWQLLEKLPRVTPTFEQARPLLALEVSRAKDEEEREGARRLYDADPGHFSHGNLYHFTNFVVSPPPLLTVRLTHAEVEKQWHDHIDRYSAPELVTARHILVVPRDNSAAADSAARAKALDLIRRAKAGEDFESLAKRYSDDPATRDQGGSLGAFGRGAMLEPFERAAFAMSPGDLSEVPVRTTAGYHVIQCIDHVPAVVRPLALVYSLVSADAALAKADQIAGMRVDSILSHGHTPAELRRIAKQLGYPVTTTNTYHPGQYAGDANVAPWFDELTRTRVGEVVHMRHFEKGNGYWIAWLDSIAPETHPRWEDVREAALQEYRKGAGDRALAAKKAEIDSLLAGGMSVDSLAVLWGGWDRLHNLQPGRSLPGLDGAALLDSLVFGLHDPPVLAVGQVSDWVRFPNGWSRLRVVSRQTAPPDQIATRAGAIRAARLESGLSAYFNELEKRYPVRILDPKLRDVSLAQPPPGLLP